MYFKILICKHFCFDQNSIFLFLPLLFFTQTMIACRMPLSFLFLSAAKTTKVLTRCGIYPKYFIVLFKILAAVKIHSSRYNQTFIVPNVSANLFMTTISHYSAPRYEPFATLKRELLFSPLFFCQKVSLIKYYGFTDVLD